MNTRRNVVRLIPIREPTKLVLLASPISDIKMTKEPRKKEELGTSSTKTQIGTRKPPSEQRTSSLPAGKRLRPISVTAKVRQERYLASKRDSNGRINSRQRMVSLSARGGFKTILNTDCTHGSAHVLAMFLKGRE